jgi:hypothetical protein
MSVRDEDNTQSLDITSSLRGACPSQLLRINETLVEPGRVSKQLRQLGNYHCSRPYNPPEGDAKAAAVIAPARPHQLQATSHRSSLATRTRLRSKKEKVLPLIGTRACHLVILSSFQGGNTIVSHHYAIWHL